MIHEILVPLDTSPLAEHALPHALAVAAAFDAGVRLVSVLEQGDSGIVDSVDWRLRRDHLESYLAQVASSAGATGIEVTWETADGPAAEQIVELARNQAADLIVMTTHGCGGWSHFRLSGTVSKVVSNAGTSVLIVRPPVGEERPDGTQATEARLAAAYKRILAPVDCSQRADWAVCLAAQIAEKHHAELLLVSVIEPPEVFCASPRSSEQNQLARRLSGLNLEVAEEHLHNLAEQLNSPSLRARTRAVQHRDAAPTLSRIAEEEDCSLVVLSAHGHSPALDRSYGSVSRHLLEACRQPVLVFQDNLQPGLGAALQTAVGHGRRAAT